MTTPAFGPRRREPSLAGLALLTTLLAATALTAGTMTGSAATRTSARASIAIKGFAFKPPTLRVKAGTKIKVTNRDDTTHTLTANKRTFDTGRISSQKTASFTVKKPGKFKYHCKIHPFMEGTVNAS